MKTKTEKSPTKILVIATPEQVMEYGERAHEAFWMVATEMAAELTTNWSSLTEEEKDHVEDQMGAVLRKFLDGREYDWPEGK